MRSTACLALITAILLLVPVQALAAELLSPVVVQGLEQLSRAKAAYTPVVTEWPTASAIVAGQTLASSTLTGGAASVPGTFAFTAPATVPGVGTYAASVTFTPTDTVNYNTVIGTVNVTVNATGPATPTVTAWPTASSITYGQTLSLSTLTGGAASVAGRFTFAAPDTVPDSGNHVADVIFTPTDTVNYTTLPGTVSVTVSPVTPAVTSWPTASAITQGETLEFSTLTGGAASVPGSFAFTAPSSVPGSVGTYTADVTFTPTDAVNYTTVQGTTSVPVNAAPVNYTLVDYLGIPVLVVIALAIVRLAELDRVSGPCFIATAAWGTPLAPEINSLRAFRDNALLAGVLGTAAVDLYYRVSPAIADVVAASPALAMVVRMALIPVLILVSLPVPLVMGVALLAGALLLRRIVRHRRAERERAE